MDNLENMSKFPKKNRLLETKEKVAITKKVMEDTVNIIDYVFRDEIGDSLNDDEVFGFDQCHE